MNRVLLVDDHGVVRRGLAEILREAYDGLFVGEAGDGPDGLRAFREGAWDLVLLDITLPGCASGLDLLAEFKRLRPTTPILMLSASSENEFSVRSLRLGASGYLCKQQASEELIRAVGRIARGGTHFPPETLEAIADRRADPASGAVHERLSPREFEILRLIAADKSVKEIAGLLDVSDKTVSTYIVRIREKTGLNTYVEMTRYALRNGLSS